MLVPGEEAVIARTLDKDPRALEQLLFLRYDWLIAVARRKIPRDLWGIVEAEDVVQDASVNILKGFKAFVSSSEPEMFAWMQKITQRVAVDHVRRLGKAPRSLELPDEQLEDMLNDLAIFDLRASSEMQRVELLRAFTIALERLEPDCRKVIELLYLESKSVSEAAQVMGKSEAAVRGVSAACQRATQEIHHPVVVLCLISL